MNHGGNRPATTLAYRPKVMAPRVATMRMNNPTPAAQ